MTIDAVSPWIDISHPVSPGATPTWPGSPPVEFHKRLSMSCGDNADDTTITMSVHTGTHIDAPGHFISGRETADQIPLDVFMGPCAVVSCQGVAVISAATLEAANIPSDVERLLLKTDNGSKWSPDFDEEFVGVALDGARWIADRGIGLVGVDYLSVQPFRESDDVHRTLLGAGTVVLEGLMLGHITPGKYELLCLPLRLVGVEGAPARALLRPYKL